MAANSITTRDASAPVGSTSEQVYPAQATSLSMLFVFNSGTTRIWLTRTLGVAAANAPGCFYLDPGQYQLFTEPNAIPVNALYAISLTGTGSLTVEMG